VTINNIPDDVLLEIFDLYRKTFGDQLMAERIWNNKNGWFKLAHVCHNWRSVVLASPSRLRLRLCFSGNTPTRAAVLDYFSHLPIIIDYNGVAWKASTPNRLMSALRYPNRVCRIAIAGSYSYSRTDNRIIKALDLPFPALESLELRHVANVEQVLLSESFIASIPSLRRLQLDGVDLKSLPPLLSVTRLLVDLALGLRTAISMEGASLLSHLQHMPRLRSLHVTTLHYFYEEMRLQMPLTTSTMLPELTCFRFVGESSQVEWLVAGLDTPPLRELHISITDQDLRRIPHTFDIPYLAKFIHVSEIVFLAARLTFSGPRLTTSLFTRPNSIDVPPSKIVTIKAHFVALPGSGFSAMLAALEDIFLTLTQELMTHLSPFQDLVPWRKVFENFCNVKVVRLHHGLETKFVDMLQQPAQQEVDLDATTLSGTPINSNRNQSTLDIFPVLEEIVLYTNTSIYEDESASVQSETVLELFGPFVTARHEVGRPVKVFWNKDGEVPRYYSAMEPGYFSW
jgi:hypothetical protein